MTKPSPNVSPRLSDQPPDQIRAMFHAISPTYDRLNRILSGSLDRRWRERTAREVVRGLRPCRHLLDVATGTGDLAWTLARMAAREHPHLSDCHTGANSRNEFNEFQGEVTGIDFTRPMLQRAAKKYGAREFRWIEGDGLRLPLASGSFDAATIAFGLRNMADRPAALAEMVRILRPGGRLAVLEFSQPGNRAVRAMYDFYSFAILPRVGRWISGSDAYVYLAQSIRLFWTPAELSGRMRQAGLKDIRAIPLMMGIVHLHLGTK